MRTLVLKWLGATLLAMAAGRVWAGDGVWTQAAGGNWSDAVNWRDGTVADGEGGVASFTGAAPAGSEVVLPADGGTIGTVLGTDRFVLSKTGGGAFSLKSADAFWGLWQLNGGTLSLLAEPASPSVLENVRVVGPTTVSVPAADAYASISNLAGNAELTKSGNGTLSLKNTDGTSVVTLDQGALVLSAQPPPATPVAGAWFHTDATVPSSLIVHERNGTNYVETWGDARWSSDHAYSVYAQNFDTATQPFVRTNFLNGLPVVDFGSFNWPGVAGVGYGGKLTWSETSSTLYEGFLVFSDTGDPNEVQYSCDFLGNLDAMAGHFNRGVGHTLLNPDYADANLLSAVWAVDGQTVTYSHVLTPDFHVVSFASAVPVLASTFAGIGNLYAGGQRLAEVLLYTNALTAAQRRQNTDYLGHKWFARTARSVGTLTVNDNTSMSITGGAVEIGALAIRGTAVKKGESDLIVDALTGESLVVTEGQVVLKGGVASLGKMCISNGAPQVAVSDATGHLAMDWLDANGVLTKTGNGTLTIGSINTNVTGLAVEGGSVEVTNSWKFFKNYRDPWFHVDATVPTSMALNAVNGTNFVSVWGDTRYLDDTSRYTVYSINNNVGYQPFLRQNYLNGLPVVDFGSLWWPDVNEYGYGGWLAWNVACTTVYEGFLVFSDTDDRAGAKQFSDVLGNLSGGAGFFNRGEYGKLLFDAWANPNLVSAPWTVDGVPVASSAALAPGFHVISFASTVPVTAEAFARVGTWVYNGGQRLGEVLIYTNSLTEASRQSIRDYLTAKWMAKGISARPLDTLAVSAGSRLAVPGCPIAADAVSGAGTIAAPGVTVGRTLSAGDAAGDIATLMVEGGLTLSNGVNVKIDYNPPACDRVKVNGTLTLQGGGTFEVDCTAGGLRDQTPVLLEFTSIVGAENLSQWSVTGSVRSRFSAKPVLVGNTLQLAFKSHGLMLLLN